MKKLKNFSFFCSLFCSLVLFFSYKSIFACQFVLDPSLATSPAVFLGGENQSKFIVFCSNAQIRQDTHGRCIPTPCKKLGKYELSWNPFTEHINFWQQNPDGSKTQFLMFPYWPASQRETSGEIFEQAVPIKSLQKEGFLPDLVVDTPFGFRKIKALQIGDSINSFDCQQNKCKSSLVIDMNNALNQRELVKLRLGKDWITCASDQRFYLPKEKRWIHAKHLKIGSLLARKGESSNVFEAKVEEVVIEKSVDKTIISLTLEKGHTFVVSGIVVHNKDSWNEGFDDGQQEQCSLPKESKSQWVGLAPTFIGSVKSVIGKARAQRLSNVYVSWSKYLSAFDELKKRDFQATAKHFREVQGEREKIRQEQIALAQAKSPECDRRARLYQAFQQSIANPSSEADLPQSLCPEDNLQSLQQFFVEHPVKAEVLENFEENICSEITKILDNVVLPPKVTLNVAVDDNFIDAVTTLAFAIVLGVGSWNVGCMIAGSCSKLVGKALFLKYGLLIAGSLSQLTEIFDPTLFHGAVVSREFLLKEGCSGGLKQANNVLSGIKNFGINASTQACKAFSADKVLLSRSVLSAAQTISSSVFFTAVQKYAIPIILLGVAAKVIASTFQSEARTVVPTITGFFGSFCKTIEDACSGLCQFFGFSEPATVLEMAEVGVEKSQISASDVREGSVSAVSNSGETSMAEELQQAGLGERTISSNVRSISIDEYKNAVANGDIETFMPEIGLIINGRFYTQHALERIAPNTTAVIEELERRFPGYFKMKDFPEKKYADEKVKYLSPRGIQPDIVEDIIKNGRFLDAKEEGTHYYQNKMSVILNKDGSVRTVHKGIPSAFKPKIGDL